MCMCYDNWLPEPERAASGPCCMLCVYECNLALYYRVFLSFLKENIKINREGGCLLLILMACFLFFGELKGAICSSDIGPSYAAHRSRAIGWLQHLWLGSAHAPEERLVGLFDDVLPAVLFIRVKCYVIL